MPGPTAIDLRAMTEADLPAALGLSRQERWPHRLEDWRFLLARGAGVVAERGGALVGTAMGMPDDGDGATIGMVIVAPDCQGAGLGRRLMEAVMGGLGSRRLQLVATEAGLPLYRKLGFVRIGAVDQQQGVVTAVPGAELWPEEALRAVGPADEPVLAALDRAATGFSRESLLGALRHAGRGVILERAGQPTGFAFLRPFGLGDAIGPVVAGNERTARLLVSHLLAANRGKFTRLDANSDMGLSAWLAGAGLARVNGGTVMATGLARARDAAVGYFALVSQALG